MDFVFYSLYKYYGLRRLNMEVIDYQNGACGPTNANSTDNFVHLNKLKTVSFV